jgi:hypothetical protein
VPSVTVSVTRSFDVAVSALNTAVAFGVFTPEVDVAFENVQLQLHPDEGNAPPDLSTVLVPEKLMGHPVLAGFGVQLNVTNGYT